MKRTFLLASLVLLVLNLTAETVREKINFNDNWSFRLEDDIRYSSAEFDHSAWRKLDVPHDWSIEGTYNKDNPMGGTAGYLPAGIAYYRKTIAVPQAWKGQHIEIAFDGVFMNSTVWANGEELGTRPYGWVSFAYDISSIVASAEHITFAVRVDNSLQPAARWYTGSGIYADTWINVSHPIHIVSEGGVYVRTKQEQVTVDTEIKNTGKKKAKLIIKSKVLDASGEVVAMTSSKAVLAANAKEITTQSFQLTHPQRWSLDTPYLYTLRSEVYRCKRLVDVVETPFGVRDVEWKAATGVWINGENVKLQGVCNHQDAGPLGAAVPDKILRFRIQQLKDMGVNAIRTTHNPQTPQFYAMCDEMGMLVMDEIFDGWKKKAKHDYGRYHFAQWWDKDVEAWIKRDRNHPSVIIWSVGNETSNSSGGTQAQDLVALCHQLDPTRLVTSGHSGSEHMDVLGFNGASERIDFLNNLVGNDKPIVGTENTHTWQVRGYYRSTTWYRDAYKPSMHAVADLTPKEIFTNDFMYDAERTVAKKVFNSSYDNAFVRLDSRGHIEQIRDIPHYAGGFRWTGYDYIGEASYVHGGWPFKAFMGGAIDLANFEKDLYYLYQSQWTSEPMAHILPHWTHPMMNVGTEVPVWVYSNCDEVELFLNGTSLGIKRPGTSRHDMQCEWLVPYALGTLKAVAYKDGQVAVQEIMRSAGRPAQNALSVDGAPFSESGKDIVQVRATTQDSLGVMYPYGENRTYFHVMGPGQIRALGNGSPIDVEPHYGVNSRIAFYGLTRAFIASTGEEGDINLLAAAILGEKKQITSQMVSIDAKILNLRGAEVYPEMNIYYTTDGSEPTVDSHVYTKSFPVALGTTVRAIVMADGTQVLAMSERFAEDEGFVWNDPEVRAVSIDPHSEQAEEANYAGAKVSTAGADFKGAGFLDFGRNKLGYVQWYRENDGDAMNETLRIRYSCQAQGGGRSIHVIVNDVVIQEALLLPNTGSWGRHWAEVAVEIPIGRGANTIKLQSADGGPYIDQISYGR